MAHLGVTNGFAMAAACGPMGAGGGGGGGGVLPPPGDGAGAAQLEGPGTGETLAGGDPGGADPGGAGTPAGGEPGGDSPGGGEPGGGDGGGGAPGSETVGQDGLAGELPFTGFAAAALGALGAGLSAAGVAMRERLRRKGHRGRSR